MVEKNRKTNKWDQEQEGPEGIHKIKNEINMELKYKKKGDNH